MFVKINTDGAYKADQVAGCGGVIRGMHGEWLGGFAKGVGLCSAFIAELWGVYMKAFIMLTGWGTEKWNWISIPWLLLVFSRTDARRVPRIALFLNGFGD
jgi:hypothetical protein